MPAQPPLLTADPTTGRVYIVTDYGHRDGQPIAYDQTDVTEAFARLVAWWIETGRARG